MGLFAKKICFYCNKKLGLLDSALLSWKLADGEYLCSDCYGDNCGGTLAGYDFIKSKTKAQILEHMEDVKKVKDMIVNEFQATDVITEHGDPSKVLVSIDRNHRWWIIHKYPNDLLSFDQIGEITVKLDENPPSDDAELPAFIKDKFMKSYIPPRPDMPEPTKDWYMHGMILSVSILNHPYDAKYPVEIKICNHGAKLTQSRFDYYDEVYGYGVKCLEIFESLK